MDRLGLGMHSHREDEMRLFASASADIIVIFVFITLGANLPFDTIADEALPALITLAALIFVARPLTVLACLLPDRRGRWSREELVFLSWTRETGVVPAALVGILVADGVDHEAELVDRRRARDRRHAAPAVDDEGVARAPPRPGRGRLTGLDEPRQGSDP